MPHQRVVDNIATVPMLKGRTRRAARRAALEASGYPVVDSLAEAIELV